MNDEAIGPDVLEDQWEHEKVDALFRDLEQGAKVLHVQVRGTSSQASGSGADRAVTLKEAHRLFHLKEVQSIQIRYEFSGQVWCDTLIVIPEAVRIIRTELPA